MKHSLPVLYYFHDPMCSWCWGFKATFEELCSQISERVMIKRILGGLAADSTKVMTLSMQKQIKNNWSRIEATIPGVNFNFDFWSQCQPRRSTYPACRAVIAARQQGAEYDGLMTSAIQNAYYKQAKNPSEDKVLIELAQEIELDKQKFIEDFYSDKTNNTLQEEIAFSREMYVESFPSLLLKTADGISVIEIDYNDYKPMLNRIGEIINAHD